MLKHDRSSSSRKPAATPPAKVTAATAEAARRNEHVIVCRRLDKLDRDIKLLAGTLDAIRVQVTTGRPAIEGLRQADREADTPATVGEKATRARRVMGAASEALTDPSDV